MPRLCLTARTLGAGALLAFAATAHAGGTRPAAATLGRAGSPFDFTPPAREAAGARRGVLGWALGHLDGGGPLRGAPPTVDGVRRGESLGTGWCVRYKFKW